MSDLNELIEWLREGVSLGHITADEALNWIGKRSDMDAPSRLRPVVESAVPSSPAQPKIRLKKDGTPWGKRGSKKKQIEMPNVNAEAGK